MTVKCSFPPVFNERTRLVILGSLPGEASLARGEYYAHPRNQFWRLAGVLSGIAGLTGLTYPDRLNALLEARVGLWDVVAMARRAGSLDAAIRSPMLNDLGQLLAELTDLRAIAFNGAKAAAIGGRQLAHLGLPQIRLPSSSPAYTLAFPAKAEAWARLAGYLRPA